MISAFLGYDFGHEMGYRDEQLLFGSIVSSGSNYIASSEKLSATYEDCMRAHAELVAKLTRDASKG